MGRVTFELPDVGEGIAEAEIVAWHVAPGSAISEDQPLVDVMTEKATVEITSPVTGRVLELFGEIGRPAAIGATIAVFEVAGAGDEAGGAEPAVDAASAHKPPPPAKAAPAPASSRTVQQPSRLGAGPEPGGLRPLASPAVRRRARELDLDLRYLTGSGPAGRILNGDLEAAEAPRSRSAIAARGTRVEEIPIIGLRRRIAERMSESKKRIPHFSYIEEVDVTELERLRARLNSEATAGEGTRLSVLPFLARALIRALHDFPQFNALFDDEAGVVSRYEAVHLGIAVQTSAGLMVPVVRHAERLDLWELGTEITRLAEAARLSKVSREDLSGSTITITSLGPLGGVATTPVINRPEVAIIGPNRILERPVVIGGAVVVRKMMNLSCSFDHRVIDGWNAAELVQSLKGQLETPALLFVGRP